MESSGIKPLPPACHAVAKSPSNASNLRIYVSILKWLSEDLCVVYPCAFKSNFSNKVNF